MKKYRCACMADRYTVFSYMVTIMWSNTFMWKGNVAHYPIAHAVGTYCELYLHLNVEHTRWVLIRVLEIRPFATKYTSMRCKARNHSYYKQKEIAFCRFTELHALYPWVGAHLVNELVVLPGPVTTKWARKESSPRNSLHQSELLPLK